MLLVFPSAVPFEIFFLLLLLLLLLVCLLLYSIFFSFLSSSLQIVMSLFKLGVITLLLSDALISGYTAAAAFTIVVTQVGFLFGLDRDEATVPSGLFVTPRVSQFYHNNYFTTDVELLFLLTLFSLIFSGSSVIVS